jgi:hypothetical protein
MRGDTLPALAGRADLSQVGQLDSGIPPPANLTPQSFAERLYIALGPLASQDPSVGWALLIFCNAIGQMYQLLDDWMRDVPEGPGWSVLMDLPRCPPEALPWLGQFTGARPPVGLSVADQRAWIAATDGWKRGTATALQEAARATLTGQQRLVFRERDGAAHGDPGNPNYAYHLTAYSYASETPDPAQTLAALTAQKPGGIVLHYSTVTMQDYQQVKTTYATYQAVQNAYRDYAALAANQPG